MEEIKCKEFWWENGDFHVVTTEGKHLVFKGAYLESKKETISSPNIEVTEMTFEATLVGD